MHATEKTVSRSALRKRKLRRGFKTAAKRESLELRRAHGFGTYGALDVWELARSMGVYVYRLGEFGVDNVHVRHLMHTEPSAFSAALLRDGSHPAILVNDSHALERQVSNIAHELGHIACEHEEAPILSESGCREHHADVEAEAEYFSSVLLVPEQAVMRAARADVPVAQAAIEYGVSRQMMQWRFNDCGAIRRVERERARRGGE